MGTQQGGEPAGPIKIHPFELAGLGVAPFRCIGVERRVGPLRWTDAKTGVTCEVGSPGQPMGTCNYCGQGIAECYAIRSSDGKEFIVGCDCVRRTVAEFSDVPVGFREAKQRYDREQRETKRLAQRERLKARMADARLILAARPTLFSNEPHPFEYHAKQGKTLRDYYEFLLSSGGNTGRTQVCRAVEKAVNV